MPLAALIDADALRHALTALAKESADTGTLRKDGLGLIKAAFVAGPDHRTAGGGAGRIAGPGGIARPVGAAGFADPGDL